MANLSFQHLNLDWNAEPNAPYLDIAVEGNTVRLSFLLNPWAYKADQGEIGTLHFVGCSRFRWDAMDDHAWFADEGLFSKQAPEWGEFYEVSGDTRTVSDDDWDVLSSDFPNARQFLFYFRDETIEIVAQAWSMTRSVPDGH